MAKTYYIRTSLTGGGASDLDGIDGDDLNDGDIGLVCDDYDRGMIYELDASSGLAESEASRIVPDSNPGSKVWLLQKYQPYITGNTTDTTITLTLADLNEILVIDHASDSNVTVNLPSVAAANVGMWITIVKHSSGTLTIDAADSDTIADSGAGGTIYNNEKLEVYASITLQLMSATKWEIVNAHGTWITTA